MAALNCFYGGAFAKEVVSKLTKEQREKYGITAETETDAVETIRAIVERHINSMPESNEKEAMKEDIDGFISDLDSYFSVTKVPKSRYEEAVEQFNNFHQELEKIGVEASGRFISLPVTTDHQQQQLVVQLEAFLQNYSDIILYYKDMYPDGKNVETISILLREPVETEDEKTPQQKTIDNLNKIKEVSQMEIYDPSKRGKPYFIDSPSMMPDGWRPTGRYMYKGEIIRAKGVSRDVNDAPFSGPVLAAPIGNQVDKIGRFYFNKNSKLWDKEGNLADDDTLKDIIAEDLKGIFTLQGLKNLIGDFQKLEEELREKWGKNIQIISDEIMFFGKKTEDDSMIIGIPDLLVVDEKGILHTLDFKTHKMTTLTGYETVFHDEDERKWHTGETYGKQVSRYIKMQESYGLSVDPEPHIILIDTWYDKSDTVESRNKGQKEIFQTEGPTIGWIDAEGNVSMSLGEYANENPATRERILNPRDEETSEILYMEPRLHVRYEEGIGFSEELAALRGQEDIPADTDISYESQWNQLSEEEKSQLRWLFNAQPRVVKTAQGIVSLSEKDIESNPKLIGSQEIQDVANFVMYRVSRILTDLQRGTTYEDIAISQPVNDSTPSPLKGKSRPEIVKLLGNGDMAMGLNKLIDMAFTLIEEKYREDFPTQEEYENEDYDDLDFEFEDEKDYLQQKKMSDKAKWLIDHKDQLIVLGSAKLISLENFVVPKKRKSSDGSTPSTVVSESDMTATGETGDTESNQSFADLYLEGINNLEAWMLGQRNYSPKASLAQEIKRMFEDISMKDPNGKNVKDSYGWGFSMPIDATMAIQTLLDTCKDCETMEEMLEAMENLAMNPQNSWAKQVLDIINAPGNENLKTKFYRHFRKDYLNYSICQVKFDKKTGKRIVVTRIVNVKGAEDTMRQSLGSSFMNGEVGTYRIGNTVFTTVQRDTATGKNVLTKIGRGTVARQIQNDATAWYSNLKKLYAEANSKGVDVTEYVKDKLDKKLFKTKDSSEEKTVLKALTDLLHGVGIMIPEEVVMNVCLGKIGKGEGKTNNAASLFKYVGGIAQKLIQMESEKGIPTGLTGNKAGQDYFPAIHLISSYVQEYVEASVYQDGKTYYSFTNPSRLGHIIRNLKDSLGDQNKFEEYINSQFGRYTGWFKSVDGEEWLCDWVKQFADTKKGAARQALNHKVELSYIGNHYRDLGSLGFQLSILHNYFGSRDDDKNYRWFALPTMSNKPTNEFIRMLKYKNSDEIIDRVLMNTFKQEMNRMADVLYHYTHHNIATDQIDLTDKKLVEAGWTEEEIQGLKDRIDSQSVTADDLNRLATVNSGAKFHFLWYLNNEWSNEENPSFSTLVAERLNILLTPDNDAKQERMSGSNENDTLAMVRETILRNMNTIVEEELAEMKKIGLFDTEVKKVNGKEVKVLKYQEEFNGNLGEGKTFDEAVNSMESKLRDFIWQDIAANINIIQITGGDLAYYGNAINYQKRIAQVHSPGLKVMHNPEYDDGYLRSVHISDEMVRDEIIHNTEVALREYAEKTGLTGTAKEEFDKMVAIILDGLTKAEATDGQSYSSPSSYRKKLALQGEWDDTKEEAYQAISKGDFNINHLGIMLQPSKPFVTSDMAKYSGSTTMELRKTPLQDKNSEYLIILAEALARGTGIRSKLVAVCDFMEATQKFGNGKQGIDTVHFASVNKVGKSGVIDISAFDEEFNQVLELQKEGKLYVSKTTFGKILDDYRKANKTETISENDYNNLLKEYLLRHIRTKGSHAPSVQDQDDFDANERLVREGKLKREEALYNSQYVDTIPVEDYIIQQEVPAHLLQMQGQLYGSQIRILGISDITGTTFTVGRDSVSADELVKEYKELHAKNIKESFNDLMQELGLEKLVKDGEVDISTIDSLPQEERNQAYKNIEFLLQKELSKDAKYGSDMRRACSLKYDSNNDVVDFNVPLMDPIQSRRIQELINSIIKKNINKQRIAGGPVVQATAYDKNLHIRFKDQDGNILPTYDEWKATVSEGSPEEFKKFLRGKQAGIAYFECYMPIPNAKLARLMTNPDGSMMSFEEMKRKLPKDVFDSITQVIGYRIPTEDKYSMLPLKIMGFVPRAAGEVIMMPQEITYLTGSDFDIDKMYIMMKSFDIDLAGASRETVESLANAFMSKTNTTPFKKIRQIVAQVIENGNKILNGENISWSNGLQRDESWENAQKFIKWYKDYLMDVAFIEYDNVNSEDRKAARKARDNRLLDLQWAVLTNEDTASKMLNPGNFIEQKKVGRIIRILKSKVEDKEGNLYTYDALSDLSVKQLDNLLENTNPHNTTLPSSKIYFQRQNMQGTQMVGIFANNNVSHAFMTFQKVGIDLFKGQQDNSFRFDGYEIGNPENMEGPDSASILDPQRGLNGQLISKTIASFLAASVDTAKDPTLADMNVNTFTGSVAMMLARLGFDTASIGLFLSQPVIVQLSDLYFKNSTEGFYTGDTAIEELAAQLGMDKKELQSSEGIKDTTLSVENFVEHLNDTDYTGKEDNYQKRVLKGFYRLYQMAHDLQELTFCTKFNSVSNAVGPTIADTMEDFDKVDKFTNNVDNVFYIPSEDEDPRGFTDPREVIWNDPILNAFYKYTVGPKGASEVIFKSFFPHYFKGFKNVKEYFQENFLGNKRMSSKLYNQLLNEYLYYLMTYQDETFKPTVPYSTKDKDRIVKDLVKDFQAVVSIKGRKPNMILDQSLGGNCLRVRGADEFLAAATLQFNNSQLNADSQQKVRNAWSDLITMDDPDLSEKDNMRIRRFGVDLFFYNLMRNGFTFSPKTMMTLASVVVRYNATYDEGFNNYITGLSKLKDVDEYLTNGLDSIHVVKRFCSQFVRNHANNGQLIPKIDFQDQKLNPAIDSETKELEFSVLESEKYKFSKIMHGEVPAPFITLIKKEGRTLTQELYELVEVGGDKVHSEGDSLVVRYKKSNRLGLTNNFIEYDSNSDLETSYFEEIRKNSADETDEEISTEGQSKEEQNRISEGKTADEDTNADLSLWIKARREMAKVKGKDFLSKLKEIFKQQGSDSELGKAFNELLETKEEDEKKSIISKIERVFEEQNKCKK